MRYQAFLETQSGWLSLCAPCPSVDVAIDWARHYFQWLELTAKTYDLSAPARAWWRAATERGEHVVVVVTTEGDPWPTYVATMPDDARHAVVKFTRLEEDDEWFWSEYWLVDPRKS